MSQVIFTIVLLSLPIVIESNGHWSYENIRDWSHTHHYCNGSSQSPIDLQFNISQIDYRLHHMYLEEQDPHGRSHLINNGHTAQLNLRNHYVLKNVGVLSEDYIVEQVHFHWGDSNHNSTGSEHLLEGRSYPLEMHVVTYSNWFSSIGEAMPNTRALAVVGAFFELSHEPNLLLQPIVKALAHIPSQGDQMSVSEDFDLKALLSVKRMDRYYRYDGSLTTPNCYESVIWSVLQEPLKLSYNQLRAFHSLHDEKGKLMKNTHRRPQPLGTRKLFRSFRSENIYDDEPGKGISAVESGGRHLLIDMKLVFVLITFLMMII